MEDSLSILPSSVRLSFPLDSSTKVLYDINTGKAKLTYINKPDSILICYSVLPFKFNKPIFHRNPSFLDSNNYYREDLFSKRIQAPPESREEIFSSPGLNKNGSISRGISMGNNQNVFVNSALNLQLDGKLSDEISLTAAISDQNIPFQPEGNTQQLQEFDKVYVQIKSNKGSSITAGDIVLKNKPSNFLRYYKNVQGGFAEVNRSNDSSKYSSTTGGIAISKGKFSSMLFAKGQVDQPLEGVQGPYRLRGPNNERFITILANSEKVYLDGRLLSRGFDFDYIIDYNQAEITFTNNILITQYSVIRVDFEYTDRNYSRIILEGNHYQTYKKLDFFVNYYEEKDNPRNPLTIKDLNDAEKQVLSNIGDTLTKAIVSGVDTVGFSENRILYKDSSGVFVYSTDPSLAIFDINFTDVGQGNGRYVQSFSSANGKVFKFVGVGAGRYEPVRLLPVPRKKSMATAGVNYNLKKNEKLFFEFARSTVDSNLFSSFDDRNNGGNALKAGYVNNGKKVKLFKNYKFLSGFDYEYNSMTFSAIDRFRDPNFERDWSSNPNFVADNHILNGNLALVKGPRNNFSYKFSRRIHGSDVNGLQQYFSINRQIKKLMINAAGFYMFNNKSFQKSDWKKLNATVSYGSKYIVPGVVYNMDKNKLISDSTHQVVGSAMYYDEVKFFIKNNDSAKSKFFIDHAIRDDWRPLNGRLIGSTKANTSNIGVNTKFGANNDFSSTLTYRNLQNLPFDTVKFSREETVLGRVDWNSNLFKKHVRSELTLTTGTGRELKKQFIFIPVPVGEGTHYWKDLNNDGVQQLNEFFEAIYTSDKKFIKSYIPTDEYIRAYTNTFSYRLDITAPRSWRNKGKVKSIISKLSNISSWTINKKTTSTDLWDRFFPSVGNIPESDILSVQKSLRSTLFFNRSNPRYGIDLNYNLTDNKQLLTQGFERKSNEDVKLNGRMNFKQFFNLRLSLIKGNKISSSDFLSGRNFNIQTNKVVPELSYQPRNNLRLSINSSYTKKDNLQLGSNQESLVAYEGGFEVKVNKVSKRTINSNLKYIRILTQFNGTSFNSVIGYEMLEALQPGNNFTWNITWQERLANGLQLSFTYEGRKSDNSNMIHIGRMQVSALF